MHLLHTGPGPAGAVIEAAVAAFLILVAAVIAAVAAVACRARNPVLAQRACRPRPRQAARHAQPGGHPQGGTP